MGWVGHTLEWGALAGAPVQAASVNVRVCHCPSLFRSGADGENSKAVGGSRANGFTVVPQVGQLARDATPFSGGHHTEGFSRVRGCFVIRLAERLCLFGKPTHLRLHKLSLNSKNLLKILGLAELAYAFGGSGDVSLSIGFHFFS